MAKKQMLDYSIDKIDEYILNNKSDIENIFDYAQNKINSILQKYKGTVDSIEKYDSLMEAYISCAEESLLLYNDIEKFKGYSYLAVKAGKVCFDLFEKGHRTYMSSLNENLKTKRNISFNLNVIELPIHLLDDEHIDENEWKLPEDEELNKLLYLQETEWSYVKI